MYLVVYIIIMLTKDDLKEIGRVVKSQIQTELEPIKKDLTDVKKGVRKIEKTTDVMIDMFDVADVKLQKRVTRIEEHLNLPKN